MTTDNFLSNMFDIVSKIISINPIIPFMIIFIFIFELINFLFRRSFNASNLADDLINKINDDNNDDEYTDYCDYETINDDNIDEHILFELRCKNCGAQLNYDKKCDIITCDYCKTKYKIK